MEKKIRRISAAQRERIVARNKKVFYRAHQAIVECSEFNRSFFSYPVMGFIPMPMQHADFGARMSNTRTHKRNNR